MITEVKYKGITTSPSDYESSDGELAIGSNIISDNGALVVPDPSPTPKIEFGSNKPLFIHTPLGGTMANYIVQNGQKIRYWTYKEGDTPSLTDSDNIYTMSDGEGLYQCTAVGNTLIVLTSAGINYFLFKDGAYKNLGKELPETLLQFYLHTSDTSRVFTSDDTLFKLTDFVDASKASLYNTFNTYTLAGKQLNRKYYQWLCSGSSAYTLSETPEEGDEVCDNDGVLIGTVLEESLRFEFTHILQVPINVVSHLRIRYFGHVGEPSRSDFTISSGSTWTSGDSLRVVPGDNVIIIDLAAYNATRTIVISFSNHGYTTSLSIKQQGTSEVDTTYVFSTPSYNFAINDSNNQSSIKEYTRGSNDITLVGREGYIQGGLVKLPVRISSATQLVNGYQYKLKIQVYDNTYQPLRVYLSINDTAAANSLNYNDSTTWKLINCNHGNDPNPWISFTAELDNDTSNKYGYVIIVDPSAKIVDYVDYESMTVNMYVSTSSTTIGKAFKLTDEGKADVDIYNKVMGLANDLLRQQGPGNDKFVFPFFVRYAYRLFDGSLTKPSAPMLMVPCSGPTPTIRFDLNVVERVNHSASMYAADLHFRTMANPTALQNYSDIIKGVVIAVSAQVPTYDQGYEFNENKENITLSAFANTGTEMSKKFGYHYITRNTDERVSEQMQVVKPVSNSDKFFLANLPSYSKDEYNTKLLNSSLTYVAKEYDLSTFISTVWDSANSVTKSPKVELETGILDNIMTRELFTENTFSLSRLIPKTAFPYNNRLNVADYDQVIFNGYHAALMNGRYKTAVGYDYKMGSSVSGTSDMQSFAVVRKYVNNIKNGGLLWFFYPNNNANTAVINGQQITLKQHPVLNGSYWFDGFSELSSITSPSNPEGSSQAVVNILAEHRNKIMKATGVVTGTRVVFTYKKIAKLDPTTDVNSINAPMESFVHTITASEVTNGFYINSSGAAEEDAEEISNRIVKATIYASVTAVQIGIREFSNVAFTTGTILSYPNKIASSVLNNPFNFEASGVSQIQSERIIALSSATKALGQEQHGTHPLYVFTNDGVFGMQVDSEGRYITKNPVCRDVVLGGGESITQIDDAVVFASARGIMSLAGEQVVCISEKLNELLIPPVAITIPTAITGESAAIQGCSSLPFKEYINGSIIAFDYLNQRLIVSNKDYDYSYVYSIRTKQWSYLSSVYTNALNSYPDALMVSNVSSAYKVIDIADITTNLFTSNSSSYSGWFLTRPINLGDPHSYKVVDVLMQNGMFRQHHAMYAWSRTVGSATITVYTKTPAPKSGTPVYTNSSATTQYGFTSSCMVKALFVDFPQPVIEDTPGGLSIANPSRPIERFERDVSLDVNVGALFSRISDVPSPSGADNDSGNYSTREYAHQYGGYVSNAIQQVLYGSNDLINWHVISSSRSPRISDYSGSPYKWFRLAVRCTFLAGGSLSSVTFSWRKKFDNDRLL